MSVKQLLDEVEDAISRCARASGDSGRLRTEVQGLRRSPDARARLAVALFELELARRGDARARAELPSTCDALLAAWRSGEGPELAAGHPATEALWLRAESLLVAFETAGFEVRLRGCWGVRQDPPALARAIASLRPEGERRVEFARCLYHLELARQGVDPSRAEFAHRVGLVAEAYQDPAVARELVGADEGLAFLWQELVPYLDEFFESLEEQAEARAAAAAEVEAAELEGPGADGLPQPSTDPGSPPHPALGGEQRNVPSFRSLLAGQPAVPPGATPPPPPAADGLDEDGEVILVGEELTEAEVVEAADGPPPPPPENRPTPQLDLAGRLAAPAGPPPPRRLDAATSAFWQHTFSRLELLPGESGRTARILACESRADRKRLAEFIDTLAPHLQVPEARAMACLLSLMLAGQTKEKNLFGQPNPRRADALVAALPYLSPDTAAAARVTVWFELDGPQTREALGLGLDLLARYLAFCGHERQDPLSHAAVQAFVRT